MCGISETSFMHYNYDNFSNFYLHFHFYILSTFILEASRFVDIDNDGNDDDDDDGNESSSFHY